MKTRSFLCALGLVLCALCVPTPGFADAKTRAAQKTDIDSYFPSNQPGAITAEKLRAITKQMVDSCYVPLTDGALGSLALLNTIGSAQITDGSIVNADINASAAIALSKLATDPLARANHTGTQLLATISDAGNSASRNVGATAGTVAAGDDSRIVGSVQKPGSPATGDLLYYNGSDWVRLPRGSDTQVLTSTSSTINWAAGSGGGGGESMLEAGTGAQSIQSKGLVLAGQITVTNGSDAIAGAGTAFTGLAAQYLGYQSGVWVTDSAGGVYHLKYTVTNDTAATITAVYNGYFVQEGLVAPDAVTFPGVTGTYDYYLYRSNAAGDGGVALGANTTAKGYESTAVGNDASALGSESAAVGDFSFASGDYSFAFGSNAFATAEGAHALGSFTTASAANAVAVGYAFTNDVPNTVALGTYFDDAGQILLRAKVDGVEIRGSTPASASAAGVAGTITWDASYIYVCTATNTWKRTAIATW